MRIALGVICVLTTSSLHAWDILPRSLRYGASAALGVWVSYKLQRMPILQVQYAHSHEQQQEESVHVTLYPYSYAEPHTVNRIWAAFAGIVLHYIVDTLVQTFLVTRHQSFLAYLIGKNTTTLARMVYYAPYIDDRAISDTFFNDLGSVLESGSCALDNLTCSGPH